MTGKLKSSPTDSLCGEASNSPLTRATEPRSRAGRYAGAAVQDARRAKERTYPELLQTRRCKLVVLAIEVGGRWSQEATTFLHLLAQAKARTIPARLRMP